MRNLTFILLFAVIFSSCAALKSIDYTSIKVGMTQNQVMSLIGKPQKVIGSKRYSDGILEIYQYPTYKISPDTLLNWLYFFNNELQEWGPKESYVRDDYDRYYRNYRKR